MKGHILCAAVVLSLSLFCQADRVGVGMKAPKLDVTKWYKGAPIKLAASIRFP